MQKLAVSKCFELFSTLNGSGRSLLSFLVAFSVSIVMATLLIDGLCIVLFFIGIWQLNMYKPQASVSSTFLENS